MSRGRDWLGKKTHKKKENWVEKEASVGAVRVGDSVEDRLDSEKEDIGVGTG